MILFELTSKRLKRKAELMTKKRTPMPSIIQKISFFKRRLNFFDFAAIFLLITVITFFIYNRLQRKPTWVNVRVSVENTDWWYQGSSPSYWYASDLKIGDTVLDSLGNELAEVINIDNYDSGGPYRNIYVDLKVRVDFDESKNQYLYEFKPLVVGSSLTFNFSKEQLRGLIIEIGGDEIDYSYKTIKVEKKNGGVAPELADKIKIGDKALDSKGDLVAEILDVKNTVASHYVFSDLRGKNIQVYDLDFRDLEITIKVKTFKYLDVNFYINKAALKIGNKIWFQFLGYALEDTEIIEILD